MFEDLENAAFNNFDPNVDMGSNFDPDMMVGGRKPIRSTRPAAQVVRQSPQQTVSFGAPQPTASFTLNITNASAIEQNIEIFNPLYSVSKIKNDLILPNYEPLLSIPSSGYSVEPDPAGDALVLLGYLRNVSAASGGANAEKWIGFNKSGDMIFSNSDGLTTISCSQVPYRALLDMLMSGSFRIDKTRITYKTNAQLSEGITWRDKSFLGGEKQQSITPNDYFRPDQFQSLRVDVPVPLPIDKQKGLFMKVLAEETITMTFFISQYSRNMI